MTGDPRIREIRAAAAVSMIDQIWAVLVDFGQLGDPGRQNQTTALKTLEKIDAIVGSSPSAPRVWFPGETVPAGTPVVNHVGGIWKHHADRVVKTGWAVELQMPDETDLQAAVDRAHAEREEALRVDRHVEITEAAASEARDTSERAIPEPTEGQNP